MRSIARAAGIFYLLNVATILLAILVLRGSIAALPVKMISTACSIVVAALLYELLKVVNQSVSLIAAFFRAVACAVAVVGYVVQPASQMVIPLFAFHFIALGYLIFHSQFLPRWLGILAMVAGVSGLAFLAPALAKPFFPYFAAPALATELSLTTCLLLVRDPA